MFIYFFNYILQNILFFFLHFESNSFPKPLNAKDEKQAFSEFKAGSQSARDKLISHNLRLVAHIAKKYYSAQQEQDDYISIGTIGLIKAVNTFEIEKGKFSTYAARCIENEILMTLRSTKKNQNTVFLGDILENDKDGNPLTREDLIADSFDLTEAAEKSEEVLKLYNAIENKLSARERQVLRLRYGLGGVKPLSQQQVCEILKISRSYVSRIEKRAVEQLRGEFLKN